MSTPCFRIAACTLALGVLLPLQATWAQTTATPTATATVATQTSVGRLADAYAPAIGSAGDARAVVQGMRAGKDVTVGDTTVSGTGKTMGFGNIDIALSLASSQVGPDATSKDFLSALDGVMGQRASGMGWGEIAKSHGVSLGQVMGAAKSAKAAEQARSSKAERSSAGKSSARGDSGKGNGLGGDTGGKGSSAGGGNGGGGNGGGNGGGGGGGGGGKK